MRWLVGVPLICALTFMRPTPAAACDPDADWCGGGWWDEPAYEPPAYEPPAYQEPAWSWEPPEIEVPVRSYEPVEMPEPVRDEPVVEERIVAEPSAPEIPEPRSAPAYDRDPGPPAVEREDPRPTAADRAAELGLHAVTDVYAGELVTTTGSTTRFEALTDREDPGTFAQRIASLRTGEGSDLDARSWNARRMLSDGRLVAGDYYENYICDPSGCRLDKIVFFQDDEETARLAASKPSTPDAAAITGPTGPSLAQPSGPVAIVTAGPLPIAVSGEAPALVTPLVEGDAPRIAQVSPGRSAQPQHDVRAGLALAPLGDPLGAFEVLRGRRVRLWARATVDGAPARVRSWRLEAGDMTVLGPVAGTGDDPLVAAWPAMSPGGVPFRAVVTVEVEIPGGPDRQVAATIGVVVRSPALVQ